MKKLLLLMLLAAMTLGAQGKKAARREQTIKDAEKAWAQATIQGDEAALKKMLADDLTYTHSNAETDTKQVFIDNLKNGVRKYLKIDYENMEARAYGKVAVLTASARLEVTTRGQTQPGAPALPSRLGEQRRAMAVGRPSIDTHSIDGGTAFRDGWGVSGAWLEPAQVIESLGWLEGFEPSTTGTTIQELNYRRLASFVVSSTSLQQMWCG